VVWLEIQKRYHLWVSNPYFDAKTREELEGIREDQQECEERFYKDLEFGTGGLRGVIGAGTNRVNIYTIRKASQGLAEFIASKGEHGKKKGIVIAYDSRNFSAEFAKQAAMVFCQNGIHTFLFDALRTTPELSFALRHLNAFAGIVITASHNPKEYNGYKVYGEDGAQISLEMANKILGLINGIEDITTIQVMDLESAKEKGLLTMIGKEVDETYINSLKSLVVNPEVIERYGKDLKIVFTPLHGSGNIPVRRILQEVGFQNVLVVAEQEKPDGNFPTVKYPNPEEKEAFALALDLAKKNGGDLIIGTDPDGDRMGVLVKLPLGEFEVLTGNQVGCLLMEYLISGMRKKDTLPPNGFVVKTIVSTELARKIAEENEVLLVEVLTGFKFIGEQILLRQDQGDQKFIFGFEESYGYLTGTFSRDKDAVGASMLVAELAAYYQSIGKNLYEGLMEVYEKYGYYLEDISTFTLKGKQGIAKIKETMQTFRTNHLDSFGEVKVRAIRDYKNGILVHVGEGSKSKLELPTSDVLYYELANDGWFCIRPSGTEPKIKIYYGVSEKTLDGAKEKLAFVKKSVLETVEGFLFG
jgi:phosphoglucomutase